MVQGMLYSVSDPKSFGSTSLAKTTIDNVSIQYNQSVYLYIYNR